MYTTLYLIMISPVSSFLTNLNKNAVRPLNAYVPDGLDPDVYFELKKKEKMSSKKSDKKAYKSRSFNSFVEAMERGEAKHLFAVNPQKVKSGEIPIEDVPYMQRAGGSWDASDLKGAALRRAKKKQSQGYYTAGKWLKSDFEYEKTQKANFMSFFNFNKNSKKEETVEERAKKNKISKDAQLWRDAGALSSKEVSKLKANKINIFDRLF